MLLLLGKRKIRVWGKKLFCASFEKENMRIIGTVTGVIFETEGENES
jgi:hypothetical protein